LILHWNFLVALFLIFVSLVALTVLVPAIVVISIVLTISMVLSVIFSHVLDYLFSDLLTK